MDRTEDLPADAGLRFLSLDGSAKLGTTELSILMILKEIMERIKHAAKLQWTPLPCDWFDFIGGSGMGGVFALLLAAWRLSIDDTISAYLVLHRKVFTSVAWSNHDMEESSRLFHIVFREIAESHSKNPDESLIKDSSEACKAFTCTSNPANMKFPRVFRTYAARANQAPKCSVTEAIIASVAGHPHLRPTRLGQPQEEFISVAHRVGNPSLEVLKEAQEVFSSSREVSCIVSIGAGQQEPLALGLDGEIDPEVLERIARDTESVDQELERRFGGTKSLFYRLNVTHGLEKIAPSSGSLSTVTTHTLQYLASEVVRRKLDVLVVDLHQRPRKVTLEQLGTLSDVISSGNSEAEILSTVQMQKLRDSLNPVTNAAYNVDGPVPRRTCTANTRVNIMSQIEQWANDPDDRKVYCLVGMAGTGKTTIGKTLCHLLQQAGLLGASFFCSRADQNCSNGTKIAPTIAFQLARRFPKYCRELVKAIEEPDLVISFRTLVAAPLERLSLHALKPVVLVIDALDEAHLNSERLLVELQQLISIRSVPLKIFLTFRPEIPFQECINSPDPSLMILHEVEKDLVRHDIRLFVQERLTTIADKRRRRKIDIDSHWPSSRELDLLVDRSDRLFVYAATACEYVDGNGKGDISKRLQWISDLSRQPSHQQYGKIDDLYQFVLDEAFDSLENEEANELRDILRVVVMAKRPLKAEALAALLKFDKASHVIQRLAALQSVIHIPSNGGSITTFHASFPDFITSPERSKGHALASRESNLFLAHLCFDSMSNLHESMCDIDITVCGILDTDEISTRTIKDNISESLVYACQYWVNHCCDCGIYATMETDFRTRLMTFFEHQNLPWIECMILKGLEVIPAMQKLESWLAEDKDIRSLVYDTRRFISQNIDLLKKNCLEIYHSAVVWLPLNSHIRNRYLNSHNLPQISQGLALEWSRCVFCFSSHYGAVRSVGFSPDGKRIFFDSDACTVRIWNVVTGLTEVELKGHPARVNSVDFSPDGKQVVSGSSDKTIRVWNAATGAAEVELKGHSDMVYSVCFSPNGKRVVSGSHDKTVRVWNGVTGVTEAELKGHSDRVNSVGFSPDGKQVVSGSDDKTIRVWNIATGVTEVELKGHSGWVNSVCFSPDGKHIASGSNDRTIRVWDAETGVTKVKLKGHSDFVSSIGFSLDGERVVSGSRDRTVRVWNAMTGVAEIKLKGHSDFVSSVGFSPDGKQVVSGSWDTTVRVWDAVSGPTEVKVKGHTDWVRSVGFSPDGKQVVSGSDDKTIRIWNVATGVTEAKLKGHTDQVRSVGFSPDGKQVVSGSDDKTVRIWNAVTGAAEATLKGHSDSVRSVYFSPDGKRVVSGSSDDVRVWNVTTGVAEAEIKGDFGLVGSVAFSPDGKQVFARCFPGKDFIWDLSTGEQKDQSDTFTPIQSRFYTEDWIMCDMHEKKLWIPPIYRNWWCEAFSDYGAAFGYETGNVVIINFPKVSLE